MDAWPFGISFVTLFVGALLLQAPILQFLQQHEISALNYRQQRIPVGLGLLLWIVVILDLALVGLWDSLGMTLFGIELQGQRLEFGLLLTLIFFIGWLDDTLGARDIKGLSGHLKAFMQQGRITTGIMKVGVTTIASFWVVLRLEQEIWQSMVSFFLILLWTNAMNLLDLRPGRALKAFFLMSILILFGSAWHAWIHLYPLWIGGVTVFIPDVRAKAMLGDMGANLLGFALGYTSVVFLPFWLQIVLLLMLTVVHWIAERSSITRIIDNNRALSWLDGLGRPR